MERQGTTGEDERRKGTPSRVPALEALRRPPAAVLTAVLIAGLFFSFPPTAPGLAVAPTSIVDEWTAVKVPPPPALKPVTVDPTTTAFLILDIVTQTCNLERRPRCVASVPKIAALLARATEKKMLVIYSIVSGGKVDDILPAVRPFPGQPVVTATLDKFLGTDLDTILKGQNIKTIIVAGTAAHGAVMTTSSEAAQRGFQVDVPVDLMSAELLYAEQYVAWHLANAPAIAARITLTRSDLIRF